MTWGTVPFPVIPPSSLRNWNCWSLSLKVCSFLSLQEDDYHLIRVLVRSPHSMFSQLFYSNQLQIVFCQRHTNDDDFQDHLLFQFSMTVQKNHS
jgi:hypothetical protein